MELVIYFLFIFLISLIADGPHHYHPACGHKGSSHLNPIHALQFLLDNNFRKSEHVQSFDQTIVPPQYHADILGSSISSFYGELQQ